MEVERTVSMGGTISLGSRIILAAWMLAGRKVGIWIEDGAPLLFFDPETRELLRPDPTRCNPVRPGGCNVANRSVHDPGPAWSRSRSNGARTTAA